MTKNCFHCGQSLPKSLVVKAEIEGESQTFCCHGCRQVCEAIYQGGLQGFYQRTPQQQSLAPPPKAKQEWQVYDLEEVQGPYISESGDTRSMELFVQGIHCAACVWLIEKYLSGLPGVISAQVNLSRKRLRLHWNYKTSKLSILLQALAQIGYIAEPFDPSEVDEKLKGENRALLFRMAFAGFMMMNLLWISVALYSGANQDEFRLLFHWVALFLATPVLLYSGYPFLLGAWRSIKFKHLSMDVPIALGATVTYVYSLYITLGQPLVGEVYFDVVVNFLFIILLGRYLQKMAQAKALDATHRLLSLQPLAARVVREGEEKLLPMAAIRVGDWVNIKPGERVAVDGSILKGESSIDESMLSGESRPVKKMIGDTVSAGTLNLSGVLQVKVLGTMNETSLGRIVQRVEDAQISKSNLSQLADTMVPWFVLSTLFLAAITFIWWLPQDFEFALMAATAVLIITCPCAFGLATPMALAVACGAAAKRGILIKNAHVLESLSKVNHFVFDKTGTLTKGEMQLKSVHALKAEDTILLPLAAAEQHSQHPVALAIVSHVKENIQSSQDLRIETYFEQAGLGIQAKIGDKNLVAGNLAWLLEKKVHLSPELQLHAQQQQGQGFTTVHVAINGEECGLLSLIDPIRPGARVSLANMAKQDMQLSLLTGDRLQVARRVAWQLGGLNVLAEVLPDEKDQVVQQLQRQGNRVAFVGDGINDAAAIKRADVGFAIGSGTHISADSADVILMRDELENIQLTHGLSRRTIKTIKQNIAISFAYNIIMVPLAMVGLITPLVAAISMPLSSLLVITNAGRIGEFVKKCHQSSINQQDQQTKGEVIEWK